jgi:hypothetical protein
MAAEQGGGPQAPRRAGGASRGALPGRAPNQRMELAGAMLQRNIGWRRLRGWRPQLMRRSLASAAALGAHDVMVGLIEGLLTYGRCAELTIESRGAGTTGRCGARHMGGLR